VVLIWYIANVGNHIKIIVENLTKKNLKDEKHLVKKTNESVVPIIGTYE
jgi:hypothetical protein